MLAAHVSQRSERVLGDILAPDANSFGVVRIALALAVLISHSFWLTSGDSSVEPLVGLTGRSLGEYAVAVFFILSGLLVAQSLANASSIGEFAARRVLRVFPGLIACVLFTACLLGPALSLMSPSAYFSDPAVLGYVAKTSMTITGGAALPGVFDRLPVHGLVNGSLWTLKYELACYFVLGLLGAAGLFNVRWRTAAIALLAIVIVAASLQSSKPMAAYSQLDNARHFAVCFGLGVLGYLARERIPLHPLLLVSLLSVVLVTRGTSVFDLACAMFIGYAAVLLASVDLGALRQTVAENDLSYGVYIYAFPVQQALLQLYPGVGPVELSIAAAAIVLPLAGLSWSCVERPAMALWRTEARSSAASDAASVVHADRSPLDRLRFARPVNDDAPLEARELSRIVTATVAVHAADELEAPTLREARDEDVLRAARIADAAAALATPSNRLPRIRLVSSQDVVPMRASDMEHLAAMYGWRFRRRRRFDVRGNRIIADVGRYMPTRRARVRGLSFERHRGQASNAYESYSSMEPANT